MGRNFLLATIDNFKPKPANPNKVIEDEEAEDAPVKSVKEMLDERVQEAKRPNYTRIILSIILVLAAAIWLYWLFT